MLVADPGFDRRSVAGVLLATMIVLAIVHGAIPKVSPAWPAGVAAWLAALLVWRDISVGQRFQVGVLTAAGLAAIIWARRQGAPVDLVAVLDQNHALLAMLAAVSFLRLVTVPVGGVPEPAPRGAQAYLRTLLGIHLFGAAINLSAVTIIGDRLARAGVLEPRAATLVSRGFSAAALWSPFFAGMAVVLTYVPGARLPVLIGIGLTLACCGLAYTFAEAIRSDPAQLSDFNGYPIHFESLWVPGALTASVLLIHKILPHWPVLTVISLLALLLTGFVSWLRGSDARSNMTRHMCNKLPQMAGELWLFLAAGVLAVGLKSLFTGIDGAPPFSVFTPGAAVVTLAVAVALAAIGIHPIITVSALASWLAPIEPEPTLLALVCLMTWSIGVALSPLSATHLTLQGRYGVASTRFFRWNLSYGVFMVTLAAIFLHAYASAF